jgi:sugar phosphate isomerase/epimerase
MKLKVCLNRHTAGRGMTLPEFAELAASAGFAGADVDLSFGVEHGAAALAELYAARKLAFGGWGVPFDWRGDAAIQTDGLAVLRKQAEVAGKLGIDTCCTWIMPSSALPLHQNWHFHVQRLTPVASALAEHGLRLGLEFVSPYHLRRKFPHEFVFTPMAMLELAGDIGGNVGLLVDSFHLHAAGEPMSIIAGLSAKQIVLVHFNDAAAGPLEKIEDGKRLLPGEGVIDLKGFFAGLDAAGYAGPVSVEVFSQELSAQPPKVAAERAWGAASRLADVK